MSSADGTQPSSASSSMPGSDPEPIVAMLAYELPAVTTPLAIVQLAVSTPSDERRPRSSITTGANGVPVSDLPAMLLVPISSALPLYPRPSGLDSRPLPPIA